MTDTAKLRLDQVNLSELADALDSGPDLEVARFREVAESVGARFVHVDAAGVDLEDVVAEVARRWAAPVREGRG